MKNCVGVVYFGSLAHLVEICWQRVCRPMSDGFSRLPVSQLILFGDSLRFDHHVNILYTQPRIGSGAIPGWGEGGGGWYKDPAFVVPPAAAPRQRTVLFADVSWSMAGVENFIPSCGTVRTG